VQGIAPEARIINRRSLRSSLIAVLHADVLILGGGSLLQDSTSFRSLIYYLLLITLARLRRRRVVLWGQGLGPLRRSMSRWLVRCALPFCTAASWRDQASLRLAQSWAPNLPMCMAADPVWQMPSQNPGLEEGTSCSVGDRLICWMLPVGNVFSKRWIQWQQALMCLCVGWLFISIKMALCSTIL
jgi:polysaccharide pyruvyl transferase CsaB